VAPWMGRRGHPAAHRGVCMTPPATQRPARPGAPPIRGAALSGAWRRPLAVLAAFQRKLPAQQAAAGASQLPLRARRFSDGILSIRSPRELSVMCL